MWIKAHVLKTLHSFPRATMTFIIVLFQPIYGWRRTRSAVGCASQVTSLAITSALTDEAGLQYGWVPTSALSWQLHCNYSKTCHMRTTHCTPARSRGGSKISQRWGVNPKRGANQLFGKNFPKTPWKLINLGQKGRGASKILLYRSATEKSPCSRLLSALTLVRVL